MRISDWSSDVCSSDLSHRDAEPFAHELAVADEAPVAEGADAHPVDHPEPADQVGQRLDRSVGLRVDVHPGVGERREQVLQRRDLLGPPDRSEEQTSELQSLMRISYACLCVKTKRTEREPTQQKDNVRNKQKESK